jgi:hypothetical protein
VFSPKGFSFPSLCLWLTVVNKDAVDSDVASGRIHCLVHLTVLLQPINVAAARTFLDLAEEFDRLRLETGLGGVVHGDHHFNFDGNDITVRMNPPNTTYAFSRYSHG